MIIICDHCHHRVARWLYGYGAGLATVDRGFECDLGQVVHLHCLCQQAVQLGSWNK